MAAAQLIEASPEDAVATDERIRADLARLLQDRLVRESTLGVWVHPILIAVVMALAWPDAPHDLLLGWGGAVLLTALLRGAWIYVASRRQLTERVVRNGVRATVTMLAITWGVRSEEHTSELQSLAYLVCRLLLEKKKKIRV